MPLTPVERIDLAPVRHHRARRQPARDRQQLAAARATASTSSSITTRCAPAARAPPGATSVPTWARPRRSCSSTCASARVPIDAPLATAFFFALRTETRDLGRESTEAERQRLPRAGAAGRPQPALSHDATPRFRARTSRRSTARCARRWCSATSSRSTWARSAIPTWSPRSPTCCCRTRARASCCAWASTTRTRTCRCAPKPTTRAPARSCARWSATTARPAATARWRAPACSRASRPRRSWR